MLLEEKHFIWLIQAGQRSLGGQVDIFPNSSLSHPQHFLGRPLEKRVNTEDLNFYLLNPPLVLPNSANSGPSKAGWPPRVPNVMA